MNITGIKSAKYGSSFHKSPLFFCQRQADNSVNTPMLPSLTPGCTDFLHPGVKDGNMGAVSYTHLTLPTICSV